MAPLGTSASAPDVGMDSNRGGRQIKDRARLQSLLTKANAGEAKRSGQRPGPLRSVGGAPRSHAPPRVPTATSGTVGIGTDGGQVSRSPGERSASLGARGSTGALPQRDMPSHTENAGAYMRKLIGRDATSEGPLDWRLVQELDAVDGLLQEDQARRQVTAQRQLLKNQLDAQRADFRRRNHEKREDTRTWGDKMQADAEAFWQEQSDRRIADREAQRRFNEERATALEVTKRCRQAEKERDAAMERQMLETSALARRIEVAKDEEKKKRQQAAAENLAKERQQAAEAKKEQKKMEAIKEAELLQQAQEHMDKQDRERNLKFEKIRDAQNKKMAHFEAKTGNEAQAALKEDQARLQRCLEEKAKKDAQEHQEKLQKMMQQKGSIKEDMRSQLEERTEKRAKEREEGLKMAKQYQREAEAAVEEEKKALQQRREKAKEHADYLLSQMQQKSAAIPGPHGYEQMTEIEKSINRDRLERANNSESLQLLFRNKQLQEHRSSRITGK